MRLVLLRLAYLYHYLLTSQCSSLQTCRPVNPSINLWSAIFINSRSDRYLDILAWRHQGHTVKLTPAVTVNSTI